MDRINAAVAAVKGTSLLAPGSEVGLTIKIGNVRFTDQQTVERELRETIIKCLADRQLVVGDTQELTLVVHYDEKPGPRRQRRDILTGQVTQVARVTEATCKVELRKAGETKPLWSRSFRNDNGGNFDNVSDAAFRQQAFDNTKSALSEMNIPTHIASDPNDRLPIRYQLDGARP